MKVFLVDEDLPRSLARSLSAAGMQSIHVIEAGLRGRSDSDVLAEANRNRRTLLTADLDFSNLLQYPLGSHAGIVIARFPNETPVEVLNQAIVSAVPRQYSIRLSQRRLSSVSCEIPTVPHG